MFAASTGDDHEVLGGIEFPLDLWIKQFQGAFDKLGECLHFDDQRDKMLEAQRIINT